jgi:hypothetical protein
MTAISLGQAASRSRLGSMAITSAIKVGRLTSDGGGYVVGPAQLREQFEVGDVTSRSQEFPGGSARQGRPPSAVTPRLPAEIGLQHDLAT